MKSRTRPLVDYKMVYLGRLMLITGAWALQSFLAAFNRAKTSSRRGMSGCKVLISPALDCGSVAILSGLIGTLLTAVVRVDEHPTAGQLLVARLPSLLTPCSSEMWLYADAFHRRWECKLAHRSKAGVPLGVRRVVPGEKAGLPYSRTLLARR